MKLSQKILVIANWLENSDNDLLAEVNDENLETLATACVKAADCLKQAAEEIQVSEPEIVAEAPLSLTVEQLAEMAAVAEAFDASGDDLLQKQASVLDEILQTIGAPKGYIFNFKKAEDDKIDILKKKYKDVKEEQDAGIESKEAVEAIKKSPMAKEYRPMQHQLITRYCPDHPGVSVITLGEQRVQCSLDHKVYDYNEGFTLLNNDKVPGTSVSEQTPKFHPESHQIFDDRDGRLGVSR